MFSKILYELSPSAKAFCEVSLIGGSAAFTLMKQRAMCNDTPPLETIVELQRELGVLNRRCQLQEAINSLNEEFIHLVEEGNSKINPEIKLIEAQLEQYQQELSNLNLSDYRDCSSTDVNDLQGSLNSQTI
ncbi:MAG: hypothetical protein H0U70_10090, partial [Tatlockia sp.]|nr:hypothetical protein [Tatlockia sp.]